LIEVIDEMRAKLPGMLPIMDPDKGPGMHSTPTLDLITISSGRGVLILDDGSATELAPGDCIIQRGTARLGQPVRPAMHDHRRDARATPIAQHRRRRAHVLRGCCPL
jgi:hypothetical protein